MSHSRPLDSRVRPSLPSLVVALALAGPIVACTPNDAIGEGAASSQIALLVGTERLTMRAGESMQLHVSVTTTNARLYTIRYESSNAALVKASPDGAVAAVAAGTARIDITATLLDTGESTAASVEVTVADSGSGAPPTPAPPTSGAPPASAPTTPRPAGVLYAGMTPARWAEVDAQRAAFGDTNDCRARVAAVPTSGAVVLQPGSDIQAALRLNSTVFLAGGTHKLTRSISLERGQKLIGVFGETATLDASAVEQGVFLRDEAVLANVNLRDAGDIGINFYNPTGNRGSQGALLYQVSVGRSGSWPTSDGGIGILATQGASGNCLVSTEVFDSWNALGSDGSATSVTAHGGNADGIVLSFGAARNTLIDAHAYRNGDDGIDMWEGGVAFRYLSTAHDNGKTAGKALTGDGNGVKLGRGSASHKLYKVTANDNKSIGFNLNGNTLQPTLVLTTATGNGGPNYGNGLVPP